MGFVIFQGQIAQGARLLMKLCACLSAGALDQVDGFDSRQSDTSLGSRPGSMSSGRAGTRTSTPYRLARLRSPPRFGEPGGLRMVVVGHHLACAAQRRRMSSTSSKLVGGT